MAINKVAIVRGEWQLDTDLAIRLYIRPSILLIDTGGTHHVPSFSEPDGRRNSPPCEPAGVVFCSATGLGSPTGKPYWQTTIPEDGFRLESLPGLSATVLGVYDDNCSPFIALLVTPMNVVWNPVKMDPYFISVQDIDSINQYDQHFVYPLKRLRSNEPNRYHESDTDKISTVKGD